MKNTYIVANFGEIFLKGENKRFFEEKLFSNFLEKSGDLKKKMSFEKKSGGAFFIKLDEDTSEEEILKIENIVKNTPGFANYYRAFFCATNLEEIKETVVYSVKDFLKKSDREVNTFAISTDKTDSGVSIKSRDVNIETGSAVWNFFKDMGQEKKVNLDNPDLKINIKIRQKKSLIFLEKNQAIGGLPIGTTGNAIALFSGGIDSPVAAFLAIKRGLNITAVHFHSVPQTSPESIEKVKELIKKLSKFQNKIKLYLIPIIPLQKNIVKNCERRLSIVLQRRMFLKIAEKVSDLEKKDIQAFVTGDSLGQVASQTLENMSVVSEVLDGKNKMILRPVVTYDKREIMDLARKIGTLDISEKPHEDACSLFVPKKPETKADLENTKREEKKIDLNILDEIMKEMVVLEITNS